MVECRSEFRVVLVGGGIVGLATGWALQQKAPRCRVTVLEKEMEVSRHQTGHNSGVIHSGLYYAPGSLKARLAIRGAALLVEFCKGHSIAYELCGKVVVATSTEEVPRLRTLHERGVANGLEGIELIGPERLREIEPEAAGIRALHVPGTGIVDFSAVARKLAQRIGETGGEIRTNTRLTRGSRAKGEWLLETTGGELQCDAVINCAGLHCDRVARVLQAQPSASIMPFRGEYYQLVPSRAALVRHLIYPVPDPAFPFLGVHFTRMIGGRVEAGPNAVLALAREGYRKNDFNLQDVLEIARTPGFPSFAMRHWRTGLGEMYRSWSKQAFVRALQRLVPAIRNNDLEPAGAGVRAQAINRDGALVADFRIDETDRALHVLNAPSPAATACLAIGEYVAERAVQSLALTADERRSS